MPAGQLYRTVVVCALWKVCVYVWSSHKQSMGQPCKVAKILLAVSSTGKMNISRPPFAPETLVSRDGFGRPVPRHPAHSSHPQEK